MNELKRNVVVMHADLQVLKGLTLLLQDMDFNVIPLELKKEPEDIGIPQGDLPDLLVLPYRIANGKSSIQLVKALSDSSGHQIPTIFLNTDDTFNITQVNNTHSMVLPEQIKPGDLRKKVSEFLARHLHESGDG